MDVTDFDPRDVRIRRYRGGEPEPMPGADGGNGRLREMLLKLMLQLPAAEIERRAAEAESERARKFQAEESENNRLFQSAESARERQARGEQAKGEREYDKPYRDADLELKREELKARGNPLAGKVAEASLAAAIDSGDADAVARLAPGADRGQIAGLVQKAGQNQADELSDPETQAGLLARMQGMADAEPNDQPSATQNWRLAHERADNVLGGFGAADSQTRDAIREKLKKAFMERLKVRFPGADQEYEAPRGQSTSLFGDLYNAATLAY